MVTTTRRVLATLLMNPSLTLSSWSDGLKGSGKTMSLCHTLHFCYTQGWLVLHVPDGERTTRSHKGPGCYHCTQRDPHIYVYIFLPQLTSGWRTAKSYCPPPITPPALINHYKPPNGCATSETPTSTSFQRWGSFCSVPFLYASDNIYIVFHFRIRTWRLHCYN